MNKHFIHVSYLFETFRVNYSINKIIICAYLLFFTEVRLIKTSGLETEILSALIYWIIAILTLNQTISHYQGNIH